MTQIEAGKLENEGLGEFSHYYAVLMSCANMLYHDTIKGISKIQDKRLHEKADKYCDSAFAVGKNEKNAKLKAAKQICFWSEIIADSIKSIMDSAEYTPIQKMTLIYDVLGRGYEPYVFFAENFEKALDQLECMSDIINMTDATETFHNDLVNIPAGLNKEVFNAEMFKLIMKFIYSFFEKLENSIGG